MKTIRIDLLSHAHHLNQPLTGFHRWARRNGYRLDIRDCTHGSEYRMKKTALAVAVDGRRLVYDLADGYQSPEAMEYLLDRCDYYFKRSFSEGVNASMGYRNVYPYGLYCDVTWAGNSLLRKRKLGLPRTVLEAACGKLVTPETLERPAGPDAGGEPRVLFQAVLWQGDPRLTPEENEERAEICRTRIRLVRLLREAFDSRFSGGLRDDPATAEMAPDLALPARLTRRKNYLELMKRSAVCVASAGLHGSTGGKFGEYAAAGRAIVSEPLRYTVPGPFAAGGNYLEYTTPEECVEQVCFLLAHPEKIRAMQENNRAYTRDWLTPERLIRNTLETAGIREDSV